MNSIIKLNELSKNELLEHLLIFQNKKNLESKYLFNHSELNQAINFYYESLSYNTSTGKTYENRNCISEYSYKKDIPSYKNFLEVLEWEFQSWIRTYASAIKGNYIKVEETLNTLDSLKKHLGYKDFIHQLVSLEYGEISKNDFESIYDEFMNDDECTKIFHINRYCSNNRSKTPINDVSKLIDKIGLHNFVDQLISLEYPEINHEERTFLVSVWNNRDQDNIFDVGELIESTINRQHDLSF